MICFVRLFCQTLRAKLFGEVRWLRVWTVKAKRDELWNLIAELVEQLRFQRFDVETACFVFSRKHTSIVSSERLLSDKTFSPIAVVRPWDFHEFREIWDEIESSTRFQQERALDPIVHTVFEQVYGSCK
jgi:hypothetical protein